MGLICFDCMSRAMDSGSDAPAADRMCERWTPEYWEHHGFTRGWGDAAVRNWSWFEILRYQTDLNHGTSLQFVILAPHALPSPLVIFASYPTGSGQAWGMH